ncbi:MAG: hypothetical protein JJU02_16505 [Cryomorphaceae bacterium]|nr:hypothetical protein [Cryomorphaceae bacterium]
MNFSDRFLTYRAVSKGFECEKKGRLTNKEYQEINNESALKSPFLPKSSLSVDFD